MKSISIKLDDYLLDLVNKEAQVRKVTRMEIIRSSILNYLLGKGDAEDLTYIRAHKDEKLLSFKETFGN